MDVNVQVDVWVQADGKTKDIKTMIDVLDHLGIENVNVHSVRGKRSMVFECHNYQDMIKVSHALALTALDLERNED